MPSSVALQEPTGFADRTFSQIDQNSPTYIAAMLRRMLDQRCLLTIQIGTLPDLYTSALLEVVREAEYIVLDELTPRAGHRLLQSDTPLQIRGLVDESKCGSPAKSPRSAHKTACRFTKCRSQRALNTRSVVSRHAYRFR